MTPTITHSGNLPTRHVRTRNITAQAPNKIHDDAVAKRFGFSGGLVAGTLVYAHMTTLAVEALGVEWLERGEGEVRLLKPAYDGAQLTIEGAWAKEPKGPTVVEIRTLNEQGDVLATLAASLSKTASAPKALSADPGKDASAMLSDSALLTPSPFLADPDLEAASLRALDHPADPDKPPVPIGWDNVVEGEALKALAWCPTLEEHQDWCDAAGDELTHYGAGAGPLLQPGLVLQAANRVFSNHFALNPWIHASSRIRHLAAVGLGEPLEVRAVPIGKRKRKGHDFLTLRVSMLRAGEPVMDVEHTAIFRVRSTEDAAN